MSIDDIEQTGADDDLFAGLHRSVAGATMTTSAADVVALGRRTRTRHRAVAAGVGTSMAALVAAIGVLAPTGGSGTTVVQDVGDWVTYSDHSWTQLGVYVGKGLGFDTVHAVGCVVFALALGPALNRSIER